MNPRFNIVAWALIFEGGLALLAWVLGWLLQVSPGASLRVAGVPEALHALRLGLLATVPMLAVLVALESLPWPPFRELQDFVRNSVVPLFRGTSLIGLLAISLLAGFGEELLFRGLVQTALLRWLAVGPAILLASLLFGALHGVTFTYAALATVMGCYFGWLYAATGQLWVPLIAHTLYDFVALIYLTRTTPPRGTP